MRTLPKAMLLTAAALTIALLAATGLTNTIRQGHLAPRAHAQSGLFVPGARVATIPSASAPNPMNPLGGPTHPTTVFEVISTNADWVHLRVDQKRTDELAQQSYIQTLNQNARLNSTGAGRTDEEIEQEIKEALSDPNNPMAAMVSMFKTKLPTEKDIWINLNSYPVMWFSVN